MIDYRPMDVGDIPSGLSLCRINGWNQLPRDWELFLRSSPGRCRVATDETGKVVGTVTTIRYDLFSWIGMVLVDPSRQKEGIGSHLLDEAISILTTENVIKLDATPEGREVYQKRNFRDEFSIYRMYCREIDLTKLPASTARATTDADMAQIHALDRTVFGANRRHVIEWIRDGEPSFSFVSDVGGKIKGYCFGRHGYRFTHLGPVIAIDREHAAKVVVAALRQCHGPVILDVPEEQVGWIASLVNLGFTEVRRLVRMYHGPSPGLGIVSRQFAILGPELG